VRIGSREFVASPGQPVLFGRADDDGIVGLEAADMGISAFAGSVEWDGFWFIVNNSRKCKLLLDQGDGAQPLDCGHRHAITVERLVVQVRGAIRMHEIVVTVLPEELARVSLNRPTSGTIVGGIILTDSERDAAVALFEGYLLPGSKHQAWPRSYAEAARRLGPPRTKDSVRRQIERLRQRLAGNGYYFEGPRANYELADHLIGSRVISREDLARLPVRR
jgi:hypothetical protein